MNPGYARRMVGSRQADLQRLAGRAAPRRSGPAPPRGATAGARQRRPSRVPVAAASAWRPVAAAVGGLLVRSGTWLQDRTVPASSRAT